MVEAGIGNFKSKENKQAQKGAPKAMDAATLSPDTVLLLTPCNSRCSPCCQRCAAVGVYPSYPKTNNTNTDPWLAGCSAPPAKQLLGNSRGKGTHGPERAGQAVKREAGRIELAENLERLSVQTTGSGKLLC